LSAFATSRLPLTRSHAEGIDFFLALDCPFDHPNCHLLRLFEFLPLLFFFRAPFLTRRPFFFSRHQSWYPSCSVTPGLVRMYFGFLFETLFLPSSITPQVPLLKYSDCSPHILRTTLPFASAVLGV